MLLSMSKDKAQYFPNITYIKMRRKKPSLLVKKKKKKKVVKKKKSTFSSFKYFPQSQIFSADAAQEDGYCFSFPQLVLCCWAVPGQPEASLRTTFHYEWKKWDNIEIMNKKIMWYTLQPQIYINTHCKFCSKHV